MHLPHGQAVADPLEMALYNLRLRRARYYRLQRRVHWPAAAFSTPAPWPGYKIGSLPLAWPGGMTGGRTTSGPGYVGAPQADAPVEVPDDYEPIPVSVQAQASMQSELARLRRNNAMLQNQINATRSETNQRLKDLWWDKVLPMIVMGVGGLIGTILTIWITTRVSAEAKKTLMEERIRAEREAADEHELETQRRITRQVAEET